MYWIASVNKLSSSNNENPNIYILYIFSFARTHEISRWLHALLYTTVNDLMTSILKGQCEPQWYVTQIAGRNAASNFVRMLVAYRLWNIKILVTHFIERSTNPMQKRSSFDAIDTSPVLDLHIFYQQQKVTGNAHLGRRTNGILPTSQLALWKLTCICIPFRGHK